MTVANRDHPVARADRALITAALVALAAMALLAAVVVTVLAAPDPFDPLGDYPAQRERVDWQTENFTIIGER